MRREEGYQPVIDVRSRKALVDGTNLDDYDEVLIDVGTADMESLKRAVRMADRILVPVPPSQADVWSTQRFVRFVTTIIADLEKKPDILAVHLRALDRFSHRAESWEDMKKAAKAVDENLGALISASEKGTIFFICGDHAVHGGEKWLKNATKEQFENHRENFVALIVGCC